MGIFEDVSTYTLHSSCVFGKGEKSKKCCWPGSGFAGSQFLAQGLLVVPGQPVGWA
jgi:hypothetical protein